MAKRTFKVGDAEIEVWTVEVDGREVTEVKQKGDLGSWNVTYGKGDVNDIHI